MVYPPTTKSVKNDTPDRFQVGRNQIREFETAGLLKKEARGNMRLYSINADFQLYNEYRKLLGHRRREFKPITGDSFKL